MKRPLLRLSMWLVLAAAAAGCPLARADVTPTGSFITAVPLTVPTFRGLEPKLALEYSSNGANGWLGVGWSLAGLSTIQRLGEGGGLPTLEPSDAFYLDGRKLEPCAKLSGAQSASCTLALGGEL